jgi:VIT1/CCC1 family predicted Fe2+/Mn2+ transporter
MCVLVVAGGVAGELEDLSAEVLHHGAGRRGATADASSVAALAKVAGDTADGELETSGTADGLTALPLPAPPRPPLPLPDILFELD